METERLIRDIKAGKIFIYPTDTIYGLGCNALIEEAVNKIREMKKREEKPFSVIAPSFAWIEKNFIVDLDLKKYLPGPYTLILKKKNPDFLKWVSSTDKLGIRIPNSEFCYIIQKSNVPFITTSVNISGEKHAKKIKDVKKAILDKVDYVINAGDLNGNASTIVLNGKEIRR